MPRGAQTGPVAAIPSSRAEGVCGQKGVTPDAARILHMAYRSTLVLAATVLMSADAVVMRAHVHGVAMRAATIITIFFTSGDCFYFDA